MSAIHHRSEKMARAEEQDAALSGDAVRRRSAEVNSRELLSRLNAVFAEHSDRTGRPFEDCRLLLVNGVMPE